MGRLLDAEASLRTNTDALVQQFGEAAARKKAHFTWTVAVFASLYLNLGQEDSVYAVDMQAYEMSAAVYGSGWPRVFVHCYKATWWHWRKGHLDSAGGGRSAIRDDGVGEP